MENGDTEIHTQPAARSDEFNRLFDASYSSRRYGRVANPLDMAVYDATSGLWQLEYSPPHIPKVNTHSAVVCVGGSCRGNGTSSAAASFGVYFGPGSKWNLKGRLPPDVPQTSQVADLYSVRKALERLEEYVEALSSDSVFEAVLVSNNAYAVHGLTRDISKWSRNGFKNARGRPVIRGTEFLQLHESIQRLADRKLEIHFWLDTERRSKDAYLLARLVGRLPDQPLIAKLSPEIQYFIFDAFKDPAARRLASQLGFALPRRLGKKKMAAHNEIVEDSHQNVELLFGPTWKE